MKKGDINFLAGGRDAEAALRESEQRYRALLGLMPAAVYTCSAPEGIITFFNEHAARLWGRRPALGDSDQRFCGSYRLWRPDGAPLPHAETPMALAMREGRAFRSEEVVIERPDGSRITVLVNIDPLRDADGKVTGAINVFHDVSERRHAEEALRASETRYRAVVESQAEMVCRFRMDGTILFVNSAYARARGATAEALAGANFWDFVAEADRPGVRAMLERLSPETPELRIENRFDTTEGERWTLWTNRALAFEAAGRLLEAQSTGVDITERKQREAALREEARTLEILNRVGRTIAGELDLERTVQAVTDAATEVSGAQFGAFFYNVKNAAGEAYMLYALSGAPREAFEKFGMPRNTGVFGPTFAGEGVIRLDDVTRDPRYGKNAPHQGMPEGHLPVRSYLAAPVVSRDGEVIGGLFFGHPRPGVFTARAERLVTAIAAQAAVAIDNARLHEQRVQLIERLREADRAKDEFLATLSHELRNPLAPLRNSLELLSRAGAGERAAPIHEMMERQVNHLVRLVDDLMEMSRIARGSFELRRESIALQAVLRNAIETSEPLIAAGGHRLAVALPEEPIALEADPVRLAQVFANLLNNAARYTPPGGDIRVEARRERDETVVEVSDTGEGIEPEELPRLFEMFSQGNRTSRRSQGGLGIGLALARRLVQMHGGSVSARSDGSGKGSCFIVRLPVGAAPRRAFPVSLQETSAVAPRRVLVVDDNRDAADSLGMLLKFLGADVAVAHDGPAALETFEAYRPGIVLLDIGMPGMNGYEVARAIRGKAGGRRVPLIALSGWGQEDDRRRAREAGFDHHLIKPADIGALQSLLATL